MTIKTVRIKNFFELVKFEHTVFALPFAYLGMMLAPGHPRLSVFFWVTLAMVGARTCGMTLNRLIDLEADAKNPRTSGRPLVTGEIRVAQGWCVAGAGLVIFLFSAWRLNPLCFKLAPLVLIPLAGYHFVKRFSYLCHWTLGLVLSIAPMGGWMALSGVFSWKPVFLSLAVLFWVAGFDILYSLQDVQFDRENGLHSAPVRFGIERAIVISRACHGVAILFLLAFGIAMSLGVLYWAGVLAVSGLFIFEHRIVSEKDLSRINTAFFSVNGWIGILLLVFTFLDVFKG